MCCGGGQEGDLGRQFYLCDPGEGLLLFPPQHPPFPGLEKEAGECWTWQEEAQGLRAVYDAVLRREFGR